MALDVTIPTNDEFAVDLAEIHRETRTAVNVNETAIASIGPTINTNDITLSLAQTTLTIGTNTGTDLLDVNNEIAIISTSASPVPDIDTISNGRDGMIKYFRSNGSNYNFSGGGNIVLKNPVAVNTLELNAGDIIIFYNDGGDQASSINGTWYELGRSLMP